ncbi:MAG: DUF5606 domain-containing protein, partial [Chitinophagaceae bacterium]|nr:DUF5606 domain-containing protein [Chitinophagaceae bacterium]
MEYKEIVSVTGLGGLYQLVTTKSDGAIVRHISEKTTKFISARKHNVTPLDSIEIYTTGDNVRLHEIFKSMQDNEAKTAPVDVKTANNDDIKGYFKSVYPDMDDERVYVSDMKKMLKWYQMLKDSELLNFEVVEEAVEEPIAEEQPEEKEEKKPAKKATKKKAAAKKADD